MLLRRIIKKTTRFIRYKPQIPLVYYAATFVGLSSQNSVLLVRPMATSKPERYDIDFVTMKKTPVQKDDVDDKKEFLKMANDFKKLFPTIELVDANLDCIRLDDVLYGEYRQRFDANIDAMHNESVYDLLTFTFNFYPELKDFQEFLQRKYNNKNISLDYLSASEVINDMSQFQEFYGKYKEVNKEKVQNYREMENEFINFLSDIPDFPQRLAKELIPMVEYFEKVTIFFANGLYMFEKELESLDKEFDFEKFPLVKELTEQIEKTMGRFEEFLSSNAEINETFFKILIQCTRYKALNEKLKSLKGFNLNDIKKIIYDPSFDNNVSQVEEYWYELTGEVDWMLQLRFQANCFLYNFLIDMGAITESNNYYELAPRLYELSKDNSIYGKVASDLLHSLTEQEVLEPVHLGAYINEFGFNPKYNISDDKFTNFVLNFMLSSGKSWDRAKKELTIGQNSDIEWCDLTFFDLLVHNPQCTEKIFSDPVLEREYKRFCDFPSVPTDIAAFIDAPVLEQIRDKLGELFESFNSTSELIHSIKGLSSDYDQVCSNIVEASRYFGDNLVALDELIIRYNDTKKHITQTTTIKSPYTQIPDCLKLEDHIYEIRFLKEELGDFSDKNYVLSSLDNLLKSMLEYEEYFPDVDIESFLKLRSKLKEFGQNNSNECFKILETVLLNHSAFSRFEQELARKSVSSATATATATTTTPSNTVSEQENLVVQPDTVDTETQPYVQIPDDLKIHEFSAELAVLKRILGRPFKQVSAEEILNVLENEIENAFTASGTRSSLLASNTSDVFNFLRLKRKLNRLFDVNGNNTEVLDVVLNSQLVFDSFESSKKNGQTSSKQKPESAVAKQETLLTGKEFEVLGDFLRFSKLLFRKDVHNVSAEEFSKMVDQYEQSLDASASTYLFTKSVLEQLKTHNSEIEFYPAFLVCVYGTNSFGDLPMTSHELEAFYEDLVRSLREISVNEDKVVQDTTSVESKFDIGDFAGAKIQYNNSERLISDLDNKSSSADFEAIRLAIHSAFEDPPKPTVAPRTVEVKDELKPKVVKPVKHLSDTSHEVDKSKLEKYLQEAKKQEESKIREKEAFEWSKRAEVNAKRAQRINSKYCILTLDGEVMPISEQALGELPKEDIFKALNKFTKEELARASEAVKDMQSHNWKVIGSRVEGDKKYLVLVNNDDGSGKAFRVMRSLLATSGLVLLTVIGVNLWVEEKDQFSKAIAEYEKKAEEERKGQAAVGPFSVAQPSTVTAPAFFGKENVAGVVVPDDGGKMEKDSQQETLSWWQRLMWSK